MDMIDQGAIDQESSTQESRSRREAQNMPMPGGMGDMGGGMGASMGGGVGGGMGGGALRSKRAAQSGRIMDDMDDGMGGGMSNRPAQVRSRRAAQNPPLPGGGMGGGMEGGVSMGVNFGAGARAGAGGGSGQPGM